jgi:flagellar motility protein MotE (MotC chaperone)
MWSGSDGFLGTEVSKLKSTSAKDFAAKVLSEMIVAPALAQTPPPPAAAPGNGGPGQIVFTPAELDMLQNLKSRREELDEREREIDVRTNLLAVSERRVEERIAELKQVEATINGLLVKYDEQQEAQFAAVVKIYEAMKPKDAANILNRLEMPVLIELAERIKERTMAPILSAMDPAVANTLTVELATRRALPITGGPLK